MKQICPWCQMEITWDEEIGPEEACPHCFNELSEYRTLNIGVDEEDEAGADLLGEDPELEWNRYARTAEAFLSEQEDIPECPQCRESMVHAGGQLMTGEHFMPRKDEEMGVFLPPPFRMEVYVCPHCFAILQQLSGKDQQELIRRLAAALDDQI